MTRDDIIRMAREAGFEGLLPSEHVNGLGAIYSGDEEITEIVKRFYALAVAAEREACAKVCSEIEEKCWETWDTQADPTDQGSAIGAAHCAAAIRARSEQPPIG